MTTALFIGRFQPLHIGHMRVITRILAKHDRLIIMIGSSSGQRTPDNPLTAKARKKMIQNCCGNEARVRIVTMPDNPSNEQWVKRVLRYRFGVVYSGNRLVQKLLSQKKLVRLVRYRNISSTDIRRRILLGRGWKHLVPASIDTASFEKALRSSLRSRHI